MKPAFEDVATIEEVFLLAKKKRRAVKSVTRHDPVAGCMESALEEVATIEEVVPDDQVKAQPQCMEGPEDYLFIPMREYVQQLSGSAANRDAYHKWLKEFATHKDASREDSTPVSVEAIDFRCKTEEQMYFAGRVGKKKCQVMLDTGAMGSIISEKSARDAGGVLTKLQEYIPLVFANDTRSVAKYEVTLQVKIGKYIRPMRFLIADVGPHAIIGIPFLKTVKALIDWDKHEVLIMDTASGNEYLWSGIGATRIPSHVLSKKEAETLSKAQRRSKKAKAKLEQLSGADDNFTHKHDYIKVVKFKELERYKNDCLISVINYAEVLGQRDDILQQLDPEANTTDDSFLAQKKHPVVEQILSQFPDVFDTPTELPPMRAEDLSIDLVPGSKLPKVRPLGHTSPNELKLLQKALPALLERGQIRPSKSEYGASILFIKKSDGTMRLCVDYRGLNSITVRNRTPIPNISDMRASLVGANYFTKLDLRDGFYNLRIREEDVHKTAFRTRFGLFEFTVVPFGLTNSPASFSAMINRILGDLFDLYVISYLDDIIVDVLILSRVYYEGLHQ